MSGRNFPLAGPILNRVWYVHPKVILIVSAAPVVCLQTLATAAKPSTQRLHLRNLFAGGRRYQLDPRRDGFRLTTTSKLLWRYRKRTSSSAVLDAQFSAIDDHTTRLQMRARIKLLYLLDVFLIPTFMASIIVFVPWSPGVIAAALVMLYALSWMGHRYHAALEAHEMVYFVQTALEDLVPTQIFALGAETPSVVYTGREFSEAWQKFYNEHREE